MALETRQHLLHGLALIADLIDGSKQRKPSWVWGGGIGKGKLSHLAYLRQPISFSDLIDYRLVCYL